MPLDEVLPFNVTVMRAAKKSKAIRLQEQLAEVGSEDKLGVGRLAVLLLNLNMDG